MKQIKIKDENFDTEKYLFLRFNDTEIVAINKNEGKTRLDELLRKFSDYCNVPDDKFVKCYVLKYDKENCYYYMDEGVEQMECQINKLDGRFIINPRHYI